MLWESKTMPFVVAEVWWLGRHCPSGTWRGVAGFSDASSEGLSVSHSKHLLLCQESDCQRKQRALSAWWRATKHWLGPNLRDEFKIFFSKVNCLPGSLCDVSYRQMGFSTFVNLQIITQYLAVTVIPITILFGKDVWGIHAIDSGLPEACFSIETALTKNDSQPINSHRTLL